MDQINLCDNIFVSCVYHCFRVLFIFFSLGLKPIRNLDNTWIFAMRISLWIPGIFGIVIPIVIPIGHMVVLWFYWQNYARLVDRRFCSCSCWDTVFKGNFLLF